MVNNNKYPGLNIALEKFSEIIKEYGHEISVWDFEASVWDFEANEESTSFIASSYCKSDNLIFLVRYSFSGLIQKYLYWLYSSAHNHSSKILIANTYGYQKFLINPNTTYCLKYKNLL